MDTAETFSVKKLRYFSIMSIISNYFHAAFYRKADGIQEDGGLVLLICIIFYIS